MQPSLFEASIPSYREGLAGLRGIIDKTALYLDGGTDEAVLLGRSLAERLYPLGRQIVAACGHAEKDPALVAAIDPPKPGEIEMSLRGLRARVDAAITFLAGLDRDRINAGAERGIPHGGHSMRATEYLLRHSLPHFYFHLTIVYVTLRQQGVPIGKPDFLGDGQAGKAAAA